MARLLVQVDDPLCLRSANKGQPRMLIGSYVRVEIEGQAVASAATIEREFIRDGNSVWVMTPEGNLEIDPTWNGFGFRGVPVRNGTTGDGGAGSSQHRESFRGGLHRNRSPVFRDGTRRRAAHHTFL